MSKFLLCYGSTVTKAVENEKGVAEYLIAIMRRDYYTNVEVFLNHFKTQSVSEQNNVKLISFNKNANFADGTNFKTAPILEGKNIFDYFDYEKIKKLVANGIK